MTTATTNATGASVAQVVNVNVNSRLPSRLQYPSASASASLTQPASSTVTVTPGRSSALGNRPFLAHGSRTSSTDTQSSTTQVDYKKLYDQECSENARLRHEIEDLRKQVEDFRVKLHHQPSVEPASSDAVVDRRVSHFCLLSF